MDKEVFEKRKQAVFEWLSNPYNITLVLVLLLALNLRLYYFFITADQPLWWDEADYLAYAKNLAGVPGVEWIVSPKHNTVYPFIVAGFFGIGFSEVSVKFILQILTSFFSVWVVYLAADQMYKDRRIALICAFLLAVFWLHLFNTMRFHVGIPSLFTAFIAIWVFWKGYENRQKIFGRIDPKWAIPITVFFVMLTYSIRRGYFLFGAFFLIYILVTKDWKKLVKDRYNWLGLGIALVMAFIVETFIFSSGVGDVSGGYYKGENPINLLPVNVFSSYFITSGGIISGILFYLFWIGVIIMVLKLALSFGYLKKMKDESVRADLFHVLSIMITLAFFIFVLRTQGSFGDPRWYLPLAFASFVAIGRSSCLIVDSIKKSGKPYLGKYGKHLGIAVIVVLVGIGGIYQVRQADAIIKDRADTFTGIKEAGLFLQQVSEPEDLIVVQPQPQTAYYAERPVEKPKIFAGWNGTNTDVPFELFMEKIREREEARYVLVSFSEPNHPTWMKEVQYARNQNGQTVVAAWVIPFMDTRIDFTTGEQTVPQEKTYGDITFRLVHVTDPADVFVYEIIRG